MEVSVTEVTKLDAMVLPLCRTLTLIPTATRPDPPSGRLGKLYIT